MRVTWWGHSTVTLDVSGVRILTDPALTGQVAHLWRRRGPVPAHDARQADVVLVSHLHADHLHLPSLRLVSRRARLVLPAGGEGLVRRSGHPLRPIDVGGRVRVRDFTVTAVAAAHDGRRSPVSRFRGPALGYLIETPDARVWFAGDTDLHESFAGLGPVDLALVPVGGWGPTLGTGHLDPERAAEAVRRVGARAAIPIHYGTLWPRGMSRVGTDRFLGPGREFAERAADVAPDCRVVILDPGDTWTVGSG